ncbi:MAG: MTH938/NDUFAF3 family protein [Gammaproteobacteria bacterium]|nr:MTH938/NDUFAF3 family protein [Gammaproteobacteria bacterium]
MTRESSASNLIRAWEDGRIRVGEQWLTEHCIVTAETIVRDWAVTDSRRVTIDDLAPALSLDPELIIIGAGNTARSPDVDLMAELAERSIGVEFMQTSAACRTYNVLVHEGRRVAAALIVD